MADDPAAKQLVMRLYHDVLNERAPELVEELFAPGPNSIVQDLLNTHAALLAAIPDLHFRVHDVIAEENKIAVRWTARGTHLGDFAGIPATGTRLALRGIDIFRIEDGTIVEQWSEMDQLALLARLEGAHARRRGTTLRA